VKKDGAASDRRAEAVPVIPRRVLFGNPDRESVRISPDGTTLSYLASHNGALNVWVAPRGNLGRARPVTAETGRGVRNYLWAHTSSHILYLLDADGDENWRLFSADLRTGTHRELTPYPQAQTWIVQTSHRVPSEIVIGLNRRDPQWHDIFRLNIETGEMTLLLENNRFSRVIVDDEFAVRCAVESLPNGDNAVFARKGTDWVLWDTIPFEDTLTTQMLTLARSNTVVVMTDSRGRDTSALWEVDPQTRKKRLCAEDRKVDVGEVLCHPTGRQPLAVSFTYDRKRWQALDDSIRQDLDCLGAEEGEFSIESQSADNTVWVVRRVADNAPPRFFLYDRRNRSQTLLFSSRKVLEDYPLAKMYSAVVRAQDGLDLVCYYTLPVWADRRHAGRPIAPLPMVLVPHGGPWGRDVWGFNPNHQWLANRGYAVLSVNFRSSTGFGKAFINAGNHQWGKKVISDQHDAVRWAVAEGIADPSRVAVYGGSFGGYSALAGLAFTPEFFACGVDLVGPSNLLTLLETIPPYWKAHLELFTRRAGDHRTQEGRKLLWEHSPLACADRIIRPLLVGHGCRDPRVKQSESEQIVSALRGKGVPVTYLLYPDEGHGFVRPENSISFRAVAESFLARWLNGRCEPIGRDLEGSSITVAYGAGEIPGLEEALRHR